MDTVKGLSAEDLNFNPPRFAVDRLRAFAGEYFGVSGTLEALDGERDQNHCLVTAEGKCFVLKVSAIGEDPAAVDFQVGALLHLAQFAPALPVPRVIASLRGNPVEWLEGEDGARHMVRLLSWLPGIPFSRGAALTPLAFRNIAAFQAQLARGLRGYFHPNARHFVAWDIQRALILDPGLQTHVQPDALALCADFLRHAEHEMLPRLKTLRAQVVHADGHTGNVLRENAAAEEVVGVIDFGDMVHAPVVQDIAVVIASFTRLADMSIANAVTQIEAYNAVLPLEDEEIELLHDAVLLRMVTALFMYDFRLGATHEPPGWLAEERPDIIVALRKFLALDRAEVTAAYRAACGRVTLRPIASSAELRARREKVMGPSYSLFYREPVHLVRGEGVWLFDAQGRRYLDCYNNVASVGHCHPHVVAALARQAATLNTHTRYLHEAVVEYAERLTATMPTELSVCLLVCTGTEANDLAIRIARTVSGHNGVIVSDDAYHGNSNVVAATSTCMYPRAEQPSWIATIPAPDGFRGQYRYGTPQLGIRYADCIDTAIESLQARGQGAAAFLCDTIFDSNGTILPPEGFLARTAARIRAAGGLLIADEVQSGFYRTGERMWCFDYSGVVPDIVTLGKPIGAGHPLAAVITTPAIAAAFAAKFSYFNTFGGNPVSAVVGMAVLDVLARENTQQNVIAAGQSLHLGLERLRKKYPLIGDLRGKGLFWGLDLVKDSVTREPAVEQADRLVDLLRDEGCLIGRTGAHENVVKIRPPLVFSPANAEQLLDTLDRCIGRL
jgi:4-aminobutyrate aminotransferase-like enzyme/Ser/Thr protein kinase RdoA (MazF antagonist)